jgi:hypothetical protein
MTLLETLLARMKARLASRPQHQAVVDRLAAGARTTDEQARLAEARQLLAWWDADTDLLEERVEELRALQERRENTLALAIQFEHAT